MERIIFGDNQFFGVNHVSDEKSRAQLIQFKSDETILKTLEYVSEQGVNTFMCTTHDRMSNICNLIKASDKLSPDFKVYPCMPYAHKYANAVTDYGVVGALKHFTPGNIVGTFLKGGLAFVSNDYIKIMEIMIDAEMKMFKGINTPVIFLQNVITDLLLGLHMYDILKFFHTYVRKKYNAEAGFISMNPIKLINTLNALGIEKPIICSSINKAGFRMTGGPSAVEEVIASGKARVIAMQILAGGSISPAQAIQYVSSIPNVESILFGASSKNNIQQTISIIRQTDAENKRTNISVA
jgi:hypothetical protein